MPRPIQYGPPTKVKGDVEIDRSALLKKIVLDHIGRPDDLLAVDINPLWDTRHYRVNVFRTVLGRRKLSDSYFIMTVEDGVVSSPPMDRRYYDDILEKLSEDRH